MRFCRVLSTHGPEPLHSERSFEPVPRLVGICTPRVRRQDGFFLYGRRRQEQQGQRLPSAELGRRQAAGVLWLEARPAWALATRVKKRAEKPLHFASNARVFALMKH